MTTVLVTEVAERQLRDIAAWWRAHRPANPSLPVDELERIAKLLEHSPDLGARFAGAEIPGVRRIGMRGSAHFVYYLHDAERAMVYVLAVWGAPKSGHPTLVDPR